jgi:regulator of protease activity HflC (stomatin/prohibitin superfamily)
MNKKLLYALPLLALAACSRVHPGEVGIKVNQYGSSAGVQNQTLGVGSYWAGMGTTIYEYPVHTTTYAFTASDKEGDKTNEEFSFNDKNGLTVTADVSVADPADPVKAAILFQKYRMSMDAIVGGPIRNAIRSALMDEAANYSVEEIYGSKKVELLAKVQRDVQRYFEPNGLTLEQLYWASNIRLPEAIKEQINARVANEQQAIAAQAKVAIATAEAASQKARAQGDADATLINARADADAIKVKAEAVAQNQKIVAYEWVQKWNGKLPDTMYCSASTPCVQSGGSQ